MSSSRFAAGVGPWRARLGLARDAVRQELVARQLRAHLPGVGRVLDAGCGQATQAIRLARAGYHVLGADLSEELLDVGRAGMAAEPADVRARLELRCADFFGGGLGDERFDVVCCHGVVMYLPRLEDALATLADRLRPGGLLSLLCRNRAGIAMRAGMTGDWAGALAGFDASRYTNRLGIADLRADDPDEVIAMLDGLGLTTVAWYGVRLFTDHWGDVDPPADLDAVLAAEEGAARRDPYRRLAALIHVIARR